MGRQLALNTKIFGSHDQSTPKHLLPNTVHGNPCRQRVVVTRQPLSQFQSVFRHRLSVAQQRLKNPCFHKLARGVINTKPEQPCRTILGQLIHYQQLPRRLNDLRQRCEIVSKALFEVLALWIQPLRIMFSPKRLPFAGEFGPY